jgi:hypothetical protein
MAGRPGPGRGLPRRVLAVAAAVVAVLWLGFGMARHRDDSRTVPNPVAPSAGGSAAPAAAVHPTKPRWFGDGASWDQSEPGRVELVVGDSLAGQMSEQLTALARQRAQHWKVWAVSGAAPCDVLGSYAATVSALHPRPSRVAFAFVGNVGNRHAGAADCMVSRLWPGRTRSPAVLTAADQARIAAVYRQDLAVAIRWNRAHGIETVLVEPPAMRPQTYFAQVNDDLVRAYSALAAGAGVRTTGLVRETLTPGGRWRQAIITPDGRYALRHTDGTHLAAPYGTQLYATALLAALSAP